MRHRFLQIFPGFFFAEEAGIFFIAPGGDLRL
jgi:hypothetical protein